MLILIRLPLDTTSSSSLGLLPKSHRDIAYHQCRKKAARPTQDSYGVYS
jgi:hypothetical protein